MFHVLIDGSYYPSDNLPPNSTNKKTIERRERRKRSKNNMATWTSFTGEPMEYTVQPKADKDFNEPFKLAPLPLAVPQPTECKKPPPLGWWGKGWEIKEEGKTPMRYNDNYASASANVTTVQSDIATQRDYLLGRLARADYPKQTELSNLFNLYVDNTPKTYKDLIDAIKNGKFTIDTKVEKKLEVFTENDDEDEDQWYWGPLHGIVWAGPRSDRDGFNKAVTEKDKQSRAAKDIIMTGDAAAGLKALQDFEAWLPEVGTKAN